jgi:hypothetical protein
MKPVALLFDEAREKVVGGIYRCPAEDGPIVSVKEHYAADNFEATATFPTRDEAIDYARSRWNAHVGVGR